MTIFMQLRKVTCYPYLIEGAEPEPPYVTDEHLVQNPGTTVVLDKVSHVLDILGDYHLFRKYTSLKYWQMDGGTAHEDCTLLDNYNHD
ncbi:hypothetical protein BKA70DRAFT_95476 [Coprinopsis sp. MPI-PUGE-AT-0042]|nr:hypothetical protein BKA70DRAFT_95476 [Coprinopsis sp. MPI-PUGE-AT-0042]